MASKQTFAVLYCLGYLAGAIAFSASLLKDAKATPILEPWPHFEKYYVSPNGQSCPNGYRPLYKGSRVVLLNRNWIPAHHHKPWPRVPGTMCFPDSPNQPLPMAAVTTIVGSYQQACTQCVQP